MTDSLRLPHYLVVTVGTAGDLFPFVTMAQALQRLGRRVTVLTNRVHEAAVLAAGLPCIGLGTVEDYERLIANPEVWDPRRGLTLLLAQYRQGMPELVDALTSAAAGDASTVVLAHPLAVPGAAVARELGRVGTVAAMYLAPSNLRSCEDPMRLGPHAIPRWVPQAWRRALWAMVARGWMDPAALPGINEARGLYGLAPIASFLGHMAQAPDLSITLFPAWFGRTAADWPQPLIEGDFQFPPAAEAPLPAPLAQFLDLGPPPVVFTPGSGNVHASDFFAQALVATQRLGQRAVFLTRERAQVPKLLPAEVIWQPFVPMASLLRRSAVLVHHGGIGTTAEALRTGTPQLVTPFAYDQFDNAARVVELGVGLTIPAKRLRAQALAQRVRRLLDPAFRAAAADVAARFEAPSAETALAAAVDRFVRAHARGSP
ncbi:glycosyltransferase [Roseateles amylovorans]|uniref:Glycosyltransferase n=1 Tax=Roseateles amylovorans TaxID=2978473 RepID=A0ABY6AVA6_9BURK|nr:glycosyltransferase [Roseateles amylovorans]UXH77131.1 glycosyltransferase [Roseateles amylovorans]